MQTHALKMDVSMNLKVHAQLQHLSRVSIGKILRWKCQFQQHVTVTIVLSLVTFGDAPQIEMILIVKSSKEGNIMLQYHGYFHIQILPV